MPTKTVEELAKLSNEIGLDLADVTGKKVDKIIGFVSNDFGDAVFVMQKIVFEDGSSIFCEGEHDIPYLEPGSDDVNDRLQQISDVQNEFG